jgi:hypothetical protein
VPALLAPSLAVSVNGHAAVMRVVITVLVVLSGLSGGVAIPIAIRDAAATRGAVDSFFRELGEAGSISSVLKARQSFLVEQDVRRLGAVVARVVPKERPWLTWLALFGVVMGTTAGVLAVWA